MKAARIAAALACAAVGALAGASANPARAWQDAASSGPAFEVATVKKSPPLKDEIMIAPGSRRGNRWVTQNATLRMIIRGAYAPDFQMDGQIAGPSWIDADRFDIAGVMPDGTSPADMLTMARRLLAERFKLVARTENRELPVYRLELANRDGRLGPRLKPLGVDCEEMRKQANAGTLRPDGSLGPCATRTMFSSRMMIESTGLTMAQLVPNLSRLIGRPVLDRTGLTGYFTLKVEFAETGTRPLGNPLPQGPAAPPVDAPSVFSALPEQLGLRLVSARELLAVLVIDSVQQPTED